MMRGRCGICPYVLNRPCTYCSRKEVKGGTMAPISMLPGRLRLESRELIGKRQRTMALQDRLYQVKGVMDVEANPRTGRVLIIFDESAMTGSDLMRMAKETIGTMKDKEAWGGTGEIVPDCGGNGTVLPEAVVHTLINMAGSLLLPKPFQPLLPLVLTAIKKNQVNNRTRRLNYA